MATLCSSVLLVAASVHSLVPAPREYHAGDGYYSSGTNELSASVRHVRDASLPAEGYRLEVTGSGVTVTSADDAGAFWALQTLAQLEERDRFGVRRVPCVRIADAPHYRWRAFMLDEGRHFFGKDAVKKQIDLIAFHKMNVFHWHLTDDQGWRLEIKSHPELVQWGAVRPESPKRLSPKEGDGRKYGPFSYTHEDVREIVAYAKARHVTVVPEIDFPGHVRCVLAAHPEFSCVGEGLKPRTPRCRWGVDDDVLCVGNDAALKLFEDVLDEVCTLFDSPVIHIGGDECPVVRWKTCEKCQARKRAEKLPDERSLQAWVTQRFADYLRKKGRRIAGWDEIVDRPVPSDALVMYWRSLENSEAGRRAAAAGHEVVVTPQHRYYVSTFQGLPHEPVEASEFTLKWNTTLESVYRYNPLEKFPGEAAKKVIGVESAAWSEYTHYEHDLDWKTWPRTCAIAERGWCGLPPSGKAATDDEWNDFARRMTVHRERLLERRVNCAPFAWVAGASVRKSAGAEVDACLSVFLSDPHQSGWRGGKQPTHMNAIFEQLIGRILSMRPLPARAVVFGDIALWKGRHDDYAMARRSLDRLSSAGIEVFVTTGNHDHREVMFRYFPRQKGLSPVPGRLVSVIDLGTCDLLLLDSLNENLQGEGYSNNVGGALDDVQWEWLSREAPARRRPFLVGAHHAINDLGGRKARALLGPLDKFIGWIHGHDHTWSKEVNLRRRNERAVFRTAVIPGAGYWGDIGYATLRTYPDRAVLTLHQSDFFYPDPPRDEAPRPREYDAIVAENDGQTCTFFY